MKDGPQKAQTNRGSNCASNLSLSVSINKVQQAFHEI